MASERRAFRTRYTPSRVQLASLSGVVLATAFALFDHNIDIVIARNATLEAPPSAQSKVIQDALLKGVFAKLPAEVVDV